MSTIHQIIPVLAPHDAVGGHTMRVREALRQRGHRSEIFAEVIVGSAPEGAHPLHEFEARGTGAHLLIYQASTGSAAADWVLAQRVPFAVNYHNITPARFFERWHPEAAANMRRARNQLRAMALSSSAGLADSPFNAAELTEVGYRNVRVTPLLLDVGEDRPRADEATLERLRARKRGGRWLFVGRLAPNKCQHDLVGALAAYRQRFDPDAELVLVGSSAVDAYQDAVLALAEDLGIDGAVTIVSGLSDAELAAYYEASDVFVCASEHEGFCIPLIEAMRHELPVVAFGATAVPDTVGDAALLLEAKDPASIAATVNVLASDAALQCELRAAGSARVADFALDRTVRVFLDAVDEVLRELGERG